MSKSFLVGANVSYNANIQVVIKGQVIQMEGYYYDRYVVYEVVNDGNSFYYKLINLRTGKFDNCDLIRPLSQKFGIGYYFDEVNPQFIDDFEFAILSSKAEQIERDEKETAQKQEERNEQLKTIGRERLQTIIPADAKAIIVAEQHRDESDSMTDYFGYGTERTVILGFSTHTKDLFSELRKHAANFEETAYLAEENEKYEHREKYSGGDGYYLGQTKYSGWTVRKERLYCGNVRNIERYALIAGDEANICVKAKVQATKTETTPETVTGDFIIVDYSDKALAVFGDTKAIKDQLKAIGGRFNPNLTHEGEKKAGWVFSKSKEQEIRNLLIIK